MEIVCQRTKHIPEIFKQFELNPSSTIVILHTRVLVCEFGHIVRMSSIPGLGRTESEETEHCDNNNKDQDICLSVNSDNSSSKNSNKNVLKLSE